MDNFLELGSIKLETVYQFMYLGSNVSSNNNASSEENKGFANENGAYFGILKQLNSDYITRNAMIILYKALACSIFT